MQLIPWEDSFSNDEFPGFVTQEVVEEEAIG